MLPTLGLVVPAALGVALSPFPVVAIVVILGTDTGRRRGRIFLAAWVVGLTTVAVVVEVITSGASVEGSGPRTGVGWVKLVLGAVFLLMALKAWRGRPRPGEVARLPGWVSTLEGADARRTLLLGLGLSAANPKNLALAASAAMSISTADLSDAARVTATVAFVVIGSGSVAGAVLAESLAGDRVHGPLEQLKGWLIRRSSILVMVITTAIGASMLAEGLSILTE